MSDGMEGISRRLVVGHKRDGRNVYDPQAKRELVEACLKPGASVARLARECGVNANQLATWVRLHEKRSAVASTTGAVAPLTETAQFVQVEVSSAVPPAPEAVHELKLQARLPNGVIVDLHGCDHEHAGRLIEALGRVRCSASTKT